MLKHTTILLALMMAQQALAGERPPSPQQQTIENGLSRVEVGLTGKLKELLEPMKSATPSHLNDDIDVAKTTIDHLEKMDAEAPSSASKTSQYLHDLTLLSLWRFTLERLTYYIDLSKSLVDLNQKLLREIELTPRRPAEELKRPVPAASLWSRFCNSAYACTIGKVSDWYAGWQAERQRQQELAKQRVIAILNAKYGQGFNATTFIEQAVRARLGSIYNIEDLLSSALKREPQANATRLLKLMQDIDHQRMQERFEQMGSSSSTSSPSSFYPEQVTTSVASDHLAATHTPTHADTVREAPQHPPVPTPPTFSLEKNSGGQEVRNTYNVGQSYSVGDQFLGVQERDLKVN